jgi:hypothetical protein
MNTAAKIRRIMAKTPEITFVKYKTAIITATRTLNILSIEPMFFIITSPNYK